MYLRILEVNILKQIYELVNAHFLSDPGLAWHACLKKTRVKLELLTNYMSLIAEKRIRGGISHSIHIYAEEYMKNHYKNKELSYRMYLDANNLYG